MWFCILSFNVYFCDFSIPNFKISEKLKEYVVGLKYVWTALLCVLVLKILKNLNSRFAIKAKLK